MEFIKNSERINLSGVGGGIWIGVTPLMSFLGKFPVPVRNRTGDGPAAMDRPTHVVGPVGERLTLENLPPQGLARWTIRRKGQVVAAVNGGLLTFDEACDRYGLAIEELTSWQRAVARSGMAGLRVTRLQQYREMFEKQDRF